MYQTILSFCDASYCAASKAWGIGIWVREGSTPPTLIEMGGKGDFNNITEVESFAIHTTIQQIRSMNPAHKALTVYSDCLGAIRKFSEDIIAKDLALKECCFKHIKAHTHLRNKLSNLNRKVDRIANKQMRKHRDDQ